MEKAIKRIDVPTGTLRASELKRLAMEVFQYQYFDGIILHAASCDIPFYGTALSLILKNFHRPIVFFDKEYLAHDAAAWAELGVNGIYALGHDGLDLACRTTYEPDSGLMSPHYPPVGQWTVRRSFLQHLLPMEEKDPFLMCDAMNDKVLAFYPGDDMNSRRDLEMVSGVLIGIKGEQDMKWLLEEQMPALTRLRRNRVPVVVTGLPKDTGDPVRRRQLLLSGIISAGDMTREAALVKLMWTLARTASFDGVRLYFGLSFAGEVTQQ